MPMPLKLQIHNIRLRSEGIDKWNRLKESKFVYVDARNKKTAEKNKQIVIDIVNINVINY